jgi:hypothetical protein
MVTEVGMWEAAMEERKGQGRAGNAWMGWALWAGGVSLLLLELRGGMEYVQAGFQETLSNLMCWAPTVGMLMLKVAEQSALHWGTFEETLRAVPMVTLAFLLVGGGLTIEARSRK